LNSQQRLDTQGNRIDSGTQLNNQQRLNSEGNRTGVVAPANREGTQPNTNSNQSGVPSSAAGGVETPTSPIR
jgi:hypothetical protein